MAERKFVPKLGQLDYTNIRYASVLAHVNTTRFKLSWEAKAAKWYRPVS